MSDVDVGLLFPDVSFNGHQSAAKLSKASTGSNTITPYSRLSVTTLHCIQAQNILQSPILNKYNNLCSICI